MCAQNATPPSPCLIPEFASPLKSWKMNHSPSDTNAGMRTVKKKNPSGTMFTIVAVGHTMM